MRMTMVMACARRCRHSRIMKRIVRRRDPLRLRWFPAVPGGRWWAAAAVAGVLAATVSSAVAQPSPAPAATAPPVPTWRVSATNVMRLESWRYFEPRPGGGDPRDFVAGEGERDPGTVIREKAKHWNDRISASRTPVAGGPR